MIYEFENLTKEEQDMMLKAPALIAVLVAGVDDVIESRELKRAVELVNIKTFSEKQDLKPYYQEVDKTISSDIDDVIAALPENADERTPIISDELAKLNDVFPRLKPKFAHDLYASWKHYAHMVAQSWGGVFGINSIHFKERQVIGLPMLHEPGLSTEE
jgi:hypothetical protein